MSLLSFSVLVGITFAALVSAALFQLRRVEDKASKSCDTCPKQMSLLFRNGVLVDADDDFWLLLEPCSAGAVTWQDVQNALKPLVPDLPNTLPKAPLHISNTTGLEVRINTTAEIVRLTLSPTQSMQDNWMSSIQNAAELARLRPALSHAPNLIWFLDHDERIIWANDAFQTLANTFRNAEELAKTISKKLTSTPKHGAKRIALSVGETRQDRWFEVTSQSTETGLICFATAVDAVVQAEEAQRNFVQTLSKTFANLTTGLAIFDRNRRLQLFNPALIDLSGLSAEFLSGRPNLFEFFDKLRDQQIMPEPKNYENWRECMAKLVAAASDDRFRETWNLVDGQTFDVTGRPYPDGAIAFLFNDITAEVSLTRGFRTELETMQSSLDTIEDAMAVFNQQGVLIVSNAAYKTMWNVDPDCSLADVTILDATLEWKSAFHPAPLWPELREFVTNTSERASWDGELRSKDGREVVCRVDPISYGSTMIRFCHASTRRLGKDRIEPLQIVSA